MRKGLLTFGTIAALLVSGVAWADLTVKDGGGTTRTIFNFVCQTTKLCNATVLVNSSGTELTTASGADGVSNTLPGVQTYSRSQCWNGTTWDRCTQIGTGTGGTPNTTTVLSMQGVPSMTPVAVSSADGGSVTFGSKGDSACGTSTGVCTSIQLLKYANQQLATLVANSLSTPLGVTLNATPSLANGNGVVPTQGGSVLSQTNPLFSSITDGTNKAAVKAASTAPAATDPALVVAISPNGINANGQATMANSAPVVLASNQSSVPVTPAATESHLGEVGSNIIPISLGLTTSNNTVTTGKSIGGTLTLANAVRVSGTLGNSGTSGILQNLSLFFKDAVAGTSADLYLFNASPSSTCTDNTLFALSASDLAKVVGIVHITDFTASNTGIIAQANSLAIAYGLSSATSLFGCLVARGSFAITTTTGVELVASVLRQ